MAALPNAGAVLSHEIDLQPAFTVESTVNNSVDFAQPLVSLSRSPSHVTYWKARCRSSPPCPHTICDEMSRLHPAIYPLDISYFLA